MSEETIEVPVELLEGALYEVEYLIDYTEDAEADPLDDHAFDVQRELNDLVNGPLRMDEGEE